MGQCINHPNVETSFYCAKHDVYFCGECLKCKDPKIHCRHRPSCLIWFMDKRGGKDLDR